MVTIKESGLDLLDISMQLYSEGFIIDTIKLVELDYSLNDDDMTSLNASVAIWVHTLPKKSNLKKDLSLEGYCKWVQENTGSMFPFRRYGVYSKANYTLEPFEDIHAKVRDRATPYRCNQREVLVLWLFPVLGQQFSNVVSGK